MLHLKPEKDQKKYGVLVTTAHFPAVDFFSRLYLHANGYISIYMDVYGYKGHKERVLSFIFLLMEK